jgi:hypothetical protein
MLTALASTRHTLVALLVLAAPGWIATAWGHVEIAVDPFDAASRPHERVVDLPVVTIAILGSEHFDPSTVRDESLLFGSWRGPQVGPIRVSKRTRDVDGDGLADRLAVFRMRDEALDGFRTGDRQSLMGWLSGTIVADGVVEPFRAGALLGASDDVCAVDCVNGTTSSGTAFLRCTWGPTIGSSGGPIQCATNLATAVFPEAVGGTITGDSRMVIEAAGGRGHAGANASCGVSTASGGRGGAHGYSIHAATVSSVLALSFDDTTVYFTVGADGPSHQSGGESTIVAGQPFDDSQGDTDPTSADVFAIAAGGGGGGAGRSTDNGNCRGGKHGGDGATMGGYDESEANECGDDGTGKSGTPGGHGGNQMAGGEQCGGGGGGGGSAGGGGGTKGITGGGGPGVDQGGHGGDGFGGGGGAGRNDGHDLGGGGGGGWARASAFAPGDLAIGDDGSQQLVVTFEVLPSSP